MRKPFIITVLICISVFATQKVVAQPNEEHAPGPSPIPLEVTFSEGSWTSQLIIDKKLAPASKFGLFALTYIKANYDNDEYLRESVNLAFLKYDILKGLSVMSGALYNSHWGFRPYAGAQYGFYRKTFMAIVNSGFHLTETQNFESLAIVQYRPHLKGDWSLYTHVQGLYSQNTEAAMHDRSHFYARAGVSYKTYSFGIANNYDCYGPMHITDNKVGIFLSVLLF